MFLELSLGRLGRRGSTMLGVVGGAVLSCFGARVGLFRGRPGVRLGVDCWRSLWDVLGVLSGSSGSSRVDHSLQLVVTSRSGLSCFRAVVGLFPGRPGDRHGVDCWKSFWDVLGVFF